MESREALTGTAGDKPPRHFRRGRRPFGFGEALRRRRGRRRHGRGGSASSARRIPVIPSPVRTPSSLGGASPSVNLGATNAAAFLCSATSFLSAHANLNR